MVRREAAILGLIHRRDRRQIQLIDDVADEVREVVLRQPVARARGQQQILFGQIRAVRLRHACYYDRRLTRRLLGGQLSVSWTGNDMP